MTTNTNWRTEFDKKFTCGGVTGKVYLKTDRAFDIADFIDQCLKDQKAELLEEVGGKMLNLQPYYFSNKLADKTIETKEYLYKNDVLEIIKELIKGE